MASSKQSMNHLSEKQLQEKIAQLSHAFEVFSSETERLEKAYSALKTKFDNVNQKLAERTSTLNQKVSELDTISNYLHQILSNISQGIIFIRPDGTITTYNPAAEKILEVPTEKALFQNALELFTENMMGFSLHRSLQEKTAPGVLYPLYAASNEAKDLEISGTYVHQNKGTEGLLLLIRDLTAFKKLQTVANRKHRLQELGEMAAAVAHEIRNPLGGIEGFASLLMRDLSDAPEQKKMAENIVKGSRTLNHLVSQVLNYAKPLHMQLHNTDITALLHETTELLYADKRLSKGIKIHVECESGAPLVPLDANVFRRAILNILINGIQAMQGKGSLLMRLSFTNTHAYLSIQDTGEGISEANLEKIFSPFFTTKDDGNGFGLAEVHKIIQAHSGEISVESHVEKGTTFTIRLPLNQEEASWE